MNKYSLNDMYTKPMYEEAGYIAGMLYAAKLNELIMKESNNKKSLLDFLGHLNSVFIANNNKSLSFSNDFFFSNLKSFINTPVSNIEELRAQNNLLPKTLLSKFYLTNKKMKIAEYQYDWYEMMTNMKLKNKRIIEIRPAEKPDIYYFKLLDKDNTIEELTLKPSYIYKNIPQYELYRD